MEFGVWLKALANVITFPDIAVIFLVSTVPFGSITLNLGLFSTDKSVASELSTVIWVVVALAILPPLLTPDLAGSATLIIVPGLTTTPDSIEAEKLTTSVSLCSVNNIAFANLLAWPLLVQPNALTLFKLCPYLFL